MAEHNEKGTSGERHARAYLQQRGYTIRHVNWRIGSGELDIVAEKDNMLIIVEVKTRSTDHFEHPKDAVTDRKIRKIVNAAQQYIELFNIEMETRFDIIAILPDKDGFNIEHIEDAFMAPVN